MEGGRARAWGRWRGALEFFSVVLLYWGIQWNLRLMTQTSKETALLGLLVVCEKALWLLPLWFGAPDLSAWISCWHGASHGLSGVPVRGSLGLWPIFEKEGAS